MALMQDLRDVVRVAGTWMRDLKNTFRELKKAIPSVDKERMPDPKNAIKELEEIVESIIKAGMQNLKKLGNATQDLQGAIDSIKTKTKARGPDLQNVSGSVAEWWLDLKTILLKLKKAVPSVDKVRLSSTDGLSLDKAAEIIAGLGIPGLVLIIMMAASPWVGAAAITASLAALGPFGMLGGIATLGVLAFISRALAEFGVEIFFQRVLAKLIEGGETCEEILKKIDGYPISSKLKQKLKEFIEKFSRENTDEQ